MNANSVPDNLPLNNAASKNTSLNDTHLNRLNNVSGAGDGLLNNQTQPGLNTRTNGNMSDAGRVTCPSPSEPEALFPEWV